MAMEKGGEYLALARKYRPQFFEDVVGQEHVLHALSHSLTNNQTHHAYLLTGTRGIGKTTIARILARSMECEKGVSGHPCGECEACRQILEGTFLDVIEIDAASQSKVEDIRALLESTRYPPTLGRYKIFIIDEVHMLSLSSFNALLKTLEEPPAYVKFILATTDPQKIPATVLSRCLRLQLRALSIDEIQARLAWICEKEQVSFEDTALLTLARAARGSMRDALSLMDQAIVIGGGTLKQDDVRAMLGTVNQNFVEAIFELIFEPDDAKIKERLTPLLEEIRQCSPNYKTLLEELLTMLHDLALYQYVKEDTLECFSTSKDFLQHYCSRVDAAQIQTNYQIVIEGLREYPLAPDSRAAFEMTLLRLLAFAPVAL